MMSATGRAVAKCLILYAISIAVETVKAGESSNCFYNDELNFVYQLYDYSGNFSNVREYEIKKGVTCDFIVDVKSKVTWWSDDEISAEIQVFHNTHDRRIEGCKANSTRRYPYSSDTTMLIGPEHDDTCMIKYFLTNNNKD